MDSFNRVVWYTVWDAKTEELIASGTAELCARRLGYKNANSFASAVSHAVKGGLSSKKIHVCERNDQTQRGGQSAAVSTASANASTKTQKSPPVLEHRRAKKG